MPAYGPRTAHRLRSIPPTIFSEMSALAVRTGSLNLGQGFPDQDGPPAVIEAAVEALRAGRNQYAPGPGVPELREAVAAHQRRYYDIDLDASSQVVVTAGATEAIAAAVLGLVNPGDEMVVLEPFYDSYVACIEMAGGVRRPVTLRAPDFRLDAAALRSAVTDRTTTILLNTPHNPTGAVLDRATLQLVDELAERHDAIVVTDEVYEHLTFGEEHIPVATLPGARERTVTISSGGKTFNTTGWKVGWLTAAPALVTAILAVKQFLTYVNAAPFQPAIAEGLRLPDDHFRGIAADLAHKRDVLSAGLRAAGFDVHRSDGTYFVVADAAPLGFDDAVELCRRLPELAGVVAVPLSAFCTPAYAARTASLVRFAFCKRVEVLERAAAQLAGLRGQAGPAPSPSPSGSTR
jgi:N-succinyldiaminopimelate aminotransferase